MKLSSTFLAALQVGVAIAGVTLPDEPADKSTPQQQRLSFKGPHAVSVAWNTYEHLQQPCVQYSTDRNHLNKTACSKSSITYPSSRTWTNLVTLKNLSPATKYYYRIGSTNSSVDFFQTALAAGDKSEFTMVTLADLGLYGTGGFTTTKRSDIPPSQPALNHSTIGRLAAFVDNYDFIIHPGDLAYADDWIADVTNYNDSKDAYTAIIERFYTQLAPISARKPYMVSPGNHEADCTEVLYTLGKCPVGQYNFSDFTNRYEGMMPTSFALKSHNSSAAKKSRKKAAKLATPPFWYSFDYGMAHIVMLDTETDFPQAPDAPGGSANLDAGPFGKPGQQVAFLDADLASVDRKVTPWVIVAGHRPWYTNGNSAGCKPCQAAFEGLLYKYGVDLVAFGHVHNLQRFMPIYNGVVDPAGMKNPKAPMYTVIGGAGNIEGHSAISPTTTGNVFAYNTNFGFGTLTFYNRTSLGIKFYESPGGSLLDSSVLYKEHKKRFVRQ